MFWLIVIGAAAIIWCSYKYQATQKADTLFDTLLVELTNSPIDPSTHESFLHDVGVEPLRTHLSTARSKIAYQTAAAILEQNPTSLNAKEFALAVGRWHQGRSSPEKRDTIYEETIFDTLLVELTRNQTNPSTQEQFLHDIGVEPLRTHLSTAHSEIAYRTALAILEQNPTSLNAKTFALAVGRWHHGRSRPDKHLTIYDEQAMQNDIMLRSQVESAKQPVPELIA